MRPCRWRSVLQCPTLLALALLACGAPLRAQSIRGGVVDPAGNGVAGVVVMLRDSLTNATARALSNVRGDFHKSSTTAGAFRVRTLRIGFRPATSAPVSLAVGLARVYLDRMLMYGPRGDPPVDVNSIPPEEIEAIEYYPSAATTPMEYSTLHSTCGVIVIWTRR